MESIIIYIYKVDVSCMHSVPSSRYDYGSFYSFPLGSPKKQNVMVEDEGNKE